ncbi:MAG: ZIP family metal transporter [Halodesulfurarchaeum sp.]
MTEEETPVSSGRRHRLARIVSGLTVVAFAVVIVAGLLSGRTKLTGVVVFGFVAMIAGVAISHYVDFDTANRQVWAYGLASGAMLASAGGLLAPKAIEPHAAYGGFAIAFGYLIGYAAHELGHLSTHYDLPLNAPAAELSLHALAAGSIMGVLYGSLPNLTALFGFGVLAHKFPAGFTGSEAVKHSGLPEHVMVVPAAIVAIAAIPLSIVTPPLSPIVQATFYGISTGVFAHVGIDMLPECLHAGSHADRGGHGVIQCSRNIHAIRHRAVLSTFLGAGTILGLWQLLVLT